MLQKQSLRVTQLMLEAEATERVVTEMEQDKNQLALNLDEDQEPDPDDDSPIVHVIKQAKIHDVSFDKEPNAFGGTLEVVAPITETDIEEQEEAEAAFPPGETPEETRSNLQAIIDQYTANPQDRDNFVEHSSASLEPDYQPPFVISQEKFAYDEDEGDEYDKLTLTYYPDDRVLLDEDDEVIDDINYTVGWRNLSQFGTDTTDADVVFIRNRRMRTDFEVVRDAESPLPLHVKYGMGKEEFQVNNAAGTLKLRREDL